MRLRTAHFAALMLALMSSRFGVLDGQAQSQVKIHVTDAYGHPIPAEAVSMTITEPSKSDTPQEAVPDKTIGLSYGQYAIDAVVPGFAPTKMVAVVDQPAQIITVGMKLGAMDAPPPICAILARFVPDIHAVRVRVMALFGTYFTDVPVADGGLIEVRNLECGDYLLIAMGPSKLLGTVTVRATGILTRLDLKLIAP